MVAQMFGKLGKENSISTYLRCPLPSYVIHLRHLGNNAFPNLRKLSNNLQKETRNICVLPLSEYLRVNPDQAEPEIKRFLNLYKGETY